MVDGEVGRRGHSARPRAALVLGLVVVRAPTPPRFSTASRVQHAEDGHYT